MKTEKEIRERLAGIEADDRLHYPCATVDINAPLALIQLGLETAQNVLKWILDDPDPKPERGTGGYDDRDQT